MFVNYRFPSSKDCIAATTRDHTKIYPGIHIAIDPDKGQIESHPGTDQLELAFCAIRPDATWLELALCLEHPDWLRCSRIWLKIRAHAKTKTLLRPALRLIRQEGFQDQFPPELALLSQTAADYGTVFTLSPRCMEGVERIDLHLFFEPEENWISLHTLLLTGA